MIAITFIVRVLKFLLAFVIVAGGVAVVWIVIQYSLRAMFDAIEKSNRDSVIWLRNKWPFSAIIKRRESKRNSGK